VAKKFRSVEEVVKSFSKLNVLIIGDVILDSYLWGKVERISPEAPVPIISVTKRENRLGGAANVAINIQSLGATPLICSVIGNDAHSKTFTELMQLMNMSIDGIHRSNTRTTTVKTRIIGNNFQMLRIDDEIDDEVSVPDRNQLFKRIASIIENKKVDVIIFEDYDKGVISKSLIEQVTELAGKKKILVAVDPKKRNFNSYKHVTLLKPNLKELKDGMKLDLEKFEIDEIQRAAEKLSETNSIDTVLITLSEQGAYVYNRKEQKHVPAHIRNIADVSGAGDTVISVAALCLAAGLSPSTTAALANLAGGIVCEKAGVVPIEKAQLINEAKGLKLF
jgi:D-glycero-beta-D-manno-heptose-7-phosphate kinase